MGDSITLQFKADDRMRPIEEVEAELLSIAASKMTVSCITCVIFSDAFHESRDCKKCKLIKLWKKLNKQCGVKIG